MNLFSKVKETMSNADKEVASIAGFAKDKLGLSEIALNSVKSTSKKNPKICIVYLVSPRKHLHEKGFMGFEKEISKMDIFIESLKTAVKYLPNYPIYIFHEDYTSTDKKNVKKSRKGQKVDFC
ncbi:MAG: hypothetical protein PHT27_07890 [Candidatus Izemoplasmatales bacterium]|nr:hypothetical protein [Candidatus Izemoplasmatales bacterium]